MRINAYVTAHDPLNRIHSLRHIFLEYLKFSADVRIYLTINKEAESDIEEVKYSLSDLPLLCTFLCATEADLGFALPWTNTQVFKEHVDTNDADFYIYQEDDIILTVDNFKYYTLWKSLTETLNLEPGFIRYEVFESKKIPFDNHHEWSLIKPTKNALPFGDFQTKCFLLNVPEADCLVQLGNPYYGASILSQQDAEIYICSDSFDVNQSYLKSGFRDWPIADRRSMGLCFENLTKQQQHRRCIPVKKQGSTYIPLKESLILHCGVKYSQQLKSQSNKLIDVESFITA